MVRHDYNVPLTRHEVNVLIRSHIEIMSPAVCKAARALTGLTQKKLAVEAGIATPTIADFERGARQPHANNLKAMKEAFEARGIEFLTEESRIVGFYFRNLTARSDLR